MGLADLQELGHCGDEANVGDNKQSNCSHCTAFLATVSSEQDSCFSSRRSLFEHTRGLESLLSVTLCLDDRGEDESDLDSSGCGGDAPADGEEGCISESCCGLASEDKVGGEIKAMPAFCCSSKIFCKYLACSSMRN